MDAAINTEIFLQLSKIADDESLLVKTLNFLRSLTQTKSAAKTIGKNYALLLKQLSDYQELDDNWDGDGASPLDKKSVKNIKSLLEKSPDKILEGWHLEPDVNGTVLLVADDGNSVVNIGNETSVDSWQNDIKKIPQNVNRILYGYAEMSVEEIRNLKVENVIFDVKECPTANILSHAGIFSSINGETIIGGKAINNLPQGTSPDGLLLAIRNKLTQLAQKGLKVF